MSDIEKIKELCEMLSQALLKRRCGFFDFFDERIHIEHSPVSGEMYLEEARHNGYLLASRFQDDDELTFYKYVMTNSNLKECIVELEKVIIELI